MVSPRKRSFAGQTPSDLKKEAPVEFIETDAPGFDKLNRRLTANKKVCPGDRL